MTPAPVPCRVRRSLQAATLFCLFSLLSGRADARGFGHPRAVVRGTLTLPDHAVDGDGRERPLTGLSGIAWLGGDRYVAVLDNSRHLLRFRLRLSQAGVPLEATDLRIVTLAVPHDYEDIVPCPPAVAAALAAAGREAAASGECVLVCEEDTPAIRCFSLVDGAEIGTLPLPANLRTRRPNRGLEALAVEPAAGIVWTANEEALPADGAGAAKGTATVVRLTGIPFPRDRTGDGSGCVQIPYRVDPVHEHVKLLPGAPLSGLVALVPLGGGRLLALERSGAAGLPPFSSRLYLVAVDGAADAAAVERDLATRDDLVVGKRLVWQEALGINLEGLCAGPRLAGGGLALLGIADNGGLGTPNQLVGLALEPPPLAPDPRLLAAVAAVVLGAVIVAGLTTP
jgi:hypothetical protein